MKTLFFQQSYSFCTQPLYYVSDPEGEYWGRLLVLLQSEMSQTTQMELMTFYLIKKSTLSTHFRVHDEQSTVSFKVSSKLVFMMHFYIQR